MRSLGWAAAVWAVSFPFIAPGGPRALIRTGRAELSRSQLATILLLLGSYSLAQSSNASEILANPLAVERVVRGLLDGLALVLVIPGLMRNVRAGRLPSGIAASAMVFYLVAAVASSLYSLAPTVSAGKAFELTVAIAIVLTAATSLDPQRQLLSIVRLVVLLIFALLAAAVIGFLVLPSSFHSVDPRPGFLTAVSMTSPYTSSNGLSSIGALTFAFGFASFLAESTSKRRRAQMGAIAALGTVGMLLASGKQGLIIWATSAAVLLWLHRRRLFLVLIAPLAATAILPNVDTLWNTVTRDQATVTLSTWSGRLVWWAAGISAWSEHPWTGFGFGVGGRFATLTRIDRASASSLHNGYLETLTGLGLFGFIPLIVIASRAVLWSVRRLRSRVAVPYAILTIPLLLHTFISLGFGGWVNADFILLASLALMCDLDTSGLDSERASRLNRPLPVE